MLRVIIGSKWRSFERPSHHDFLEKPSRPKHMQNWQWTATTSENIGSRAVMESPYCMACIVWKGVLRAPALQGRFGAGLEVSINQARMQ